MSRKWGDVATEGPKWGDVASDDGDDLEVLPARTEELKNGIKTIVEWSLNEDKNKVKTTRKYRISSKVVHINKRVQERRQWAKFGCVEGIVGTELGVTSVGEEVSLDLTPKIYQKKASEEDKSALEKIKGSNVVVCRVCQGDHWTLKCPYKDELKERNKGDAGPSAPDGPDGQERLNVQPGRYVPPGLRDGAGGRKVVEPRNRDMDTAALRVTNLSEDADERDLQDLFNPFGQIQRVYLVRDRETDESRGFAFVHYYNRSDAQKAIDGISGLPYGHQILDVDWAKPRE